MKVCLSIGYGRLHLVTAAECLAKAGVGVRLICGWVPRNPDGALVRLCSKIVGRDLSSGMRKRTINCPDVEIRSMPLADFMDQGMRQVDRIAFKSQCVGMVASLGWRLFGWLSRRHIKEVQIFHCRSGAGRGGAITVAKRRGMKVVVDHSIAHPAFMDMHLREEYEKNGLQFNLGMDSAFWRQVIRDCEEADVLQVNSYFVRDTFEEQGFPPEKIKVVYLGEREDFMGLRKCRERPEVVRLLFTGGFSFRKGAEYIMEALKILRSRGVVFVMDVVGDFSSSKELIARYSKYNLPVVFHGPKPQDELKSFLANGDIYVFPSLAEGCAQSGMEAMAAGMCVVGTYESGFPIVDGENGYIVPARDANAIADKVEWLATQWNEVNRVGANAAKLIAENYTWRQYAINTRKVYEEVLLKV